MKFLLEKRPIESTAPGRTYHIAFNVINAVIQDSGSWYFSAEVGISSAESDRNVLKETMMGYGHMIDVRFQVLLETLKVLDVSLKEEVDLLLAGPPYNTWCEAGKPDFFYDVLQKRNIGHMLSLGEVILRSGGHGVVFCCTVVFGLG